MTTKRLRECRGFVDTINELCSCGGSDRENGCDACKIYHAIGDWLTVEAPVPTQKEAPAAPVEKRCGTCAHYSPGDNEYSGRCEADFPAGATDQCPMKPEQGTRCPCWKAKP